MGELNLELSKEGKEEQSSMRKEDGGLEERSMSRETEKYNVAGTQKSKGEKRRMRRLRASLRSLDAFLQERGTEGFQAGIIMTNVTL